MALTINHNIASLMAQGQLGKSTAQLQNAFERLSSGLRINHAGDDPAGLAVATGLEADSRILSQAVRNVNDGISLLSVAEGALRELSSILARQGELAEQAANGVYTLSQRQALQKEADALTGEYNRIIDSTEFNGLGLYKASKIPLSLQVGSGEADSISFVLGEALARTAGDGTFASAISVGIPGNGLDTNVVDVNGDGHSDLLVSQTNGGGVNVILGNGDGTFGSPVGYTMYNYPATVLAEDINGDGNLDMLSTSLTYDVVSVCLGNGNGTFQSYATYGFGDYVRDIVLDDFNGDGKLDIAGGARDGGALNVILGQGDGTFGTLLSFAAPAGGIFNIDKGDVNGDGICDIVSTNYDATIGIYLGKGDGTFEQGIQLAASANQMDIKLFDVDRDGILDIISNHNSGQDQVDIYLGRGGGLFKERVSYNISESNKRSLTVDDFNGDGLYDIAAAGTANGIVDVLYGQGDGTFNAGYTISAGSNFYQICSGDVNGDSISDMVATSYTGKSVSIFLGHAKEKNTQAYFSLLTREDALESIGKVKTTADHVSAELGSIGARQSRLSHTVNHLWQMREGYQTAYGRIMDADVAEEVARMVRNQVLQQAATAVMAQANQQPALVLQLLK